MNAIERVLRRVDEAQQRHTVTSVIFAVVKKYGDDNAGALTTQLAYTLFVTVFPLLLLAVTVAGIVLAGDPGARQRLLHTAFGQFPIVGSTLAHNIHALRRSSVVGLVVGVVGLAYGSTNLAQAGLYTMEQIWNIPGASRPNFVTRLGRSLAFLTVLAVGLVVTTTLSGFGTFGRHDVWLGSLGEVLALAVNASLYLAAFRVLTPRRLAWRSLAPGAVVAALGWTLLQALGGYVVGHDLRGASALYGMFGLVLGLLAWIYLGAEITVYAAELNTVLLRRLWPRSIVQPPLTAADQASLALQATQNQRRPEQEVSTSFRGRPMTQTEYRRRGYRDDPGTPGLARRVPEGPPSPPPAQPVPPHSADATDA